MFNIRFSLTNPWWDRFESLRHWHGATPVKNKYWEIQLMKSDDIVAFDLRVTARSDHAGVDIWIGLLGYAINFIVYDSRHWDQDSDAWVLQDGSR